MYPQNYNVKFGKETEQCGWIPATSQWLGNWRMSIDRCAHSVIELTERYYTSQVLPLLPAIPSRLALPLDLKPL
jgi:hypothetical protein